MAQVLTRAAFDIAVEFGARTITGGANSPHVLTRVGFDVPVEFGPRAITGGANSPHALTRASFDIAVEFGARTITGGMLGAHLLTRASFDVAVQFGARTITGGALPAPPPPPPPASGPVLLVRELPPLDLDVELTDPDGQRRLLAGRADAPGDRPQGLQFTTKRGEGFSTAAFTLARRADRDWPDLGLYDGVALVGHQGDTAFEGRFARAPRTIDQAHSIGVDAIGWIAHARDRRMSEIYVDRDLSRWGTMSAPRRGTLLTSGRAIANDPSIAPDPVTRRAALVTALSDTWSLVPVCEAHYDAGPNLRVARVFWDVLPADTINVTDPNWDWQLYSSVDGNVPEQPSGPLRGVAARNTYTPGTPRRFVFIQQTYVVAPAGEDAKNYELYWRDLAAYGDHGLPLIGTDDPKGVAASDVLKHLFGKYCPQLRAGAFITPTSYPIGHLVFTDRVFPYDAALDINKLHLFELAVWEDREVHWGSVDLSDYDWEIRAGDPGVTVQMQGDSAEDLANGIEVEYDDVQTGRREVLLPDDYPELRDGDVENPVNRHGLQVHTSITLSSPAIRDDALQIGRGALAEHNQPKAPGTITVEGYVRDRAGNEQPAWKVRATDRVAITSSTAWSDRPRIIGETSYDHDKRTATIAVDSSLPRMSAFQDRLATALRAQGLAS